MGDHPDYLAKMPGYRIALFITTKACAHVQAFCSNVD
jgi:hypothetical protein